MAAVPLSVYIGGLQPGGGAALLRDGTPPVPPPADPLQTLRPAVAEPDAARADANTALTLARFAGKGAGLAGFDNQYLGPGLDLADLAINPSPGKAIKTAINLLPQGAKLASDLLSTGAGAGEGLTAAGMTATEAALAGGEAAAGAVPAAATVGSSAAAGLTAGLAALPFMLFAGGGPLKFLADIDYKQRIRRTRDAQTLQAPIVAPLTEVRRPQDFDAAVATRVGDTTVGDTLAAILKYNLNGTWALDTSHDWLPNLALKPLQDALTARGYRGDREPKLGDVGGVGEIVAGAGDRLLPMGRIDELSMRQTSDGQLEPAGDPRSGPSGAALGAEGWENVLRRLTSVVTGTPMDQIPSTTAFLRRQTVAATPGTGHTQGEEWVADAPTRPETDDEMLTRLGLAGNSTIRGRLQARADAEAMAASMSSPGGGE